MKRAFVYSLLVVFVFSVHSTSVGIAAPIIVSPNADPAESAIAKELARQLGRVYTNDTFAIRTELPDGSCILIGDIGSNPHIRTLLDTHLPSLPESFRIATIHRGSNKILVIAGADVWGVIYGVYALLERLGWSFFLSYDTCPPERSVSFSFDDFSVDDQPVTSERIVFNWHNFLSSCSTWNIDDWRQWIEQSRKMRFNGIMVHAYGNNPMFQFSFNSKTKPVGYLSTTAKGRDWSTQHVNDVRRLWGGEVFDGPVFGADAAVVPDDQRVTAATGLMREVFHYADQLRMKTWFALDVDTESANPQELIMTLPESDRFVVDRKAVDWMGQQSGPFWLANPDRPEGYRYYLEQVRALVELYPTLDHIVLWFRKHDTPWMGLDVEEMPEDWQQRYKALVAQSLKIAETWKGHNCFAIGKLAAAFERALKDIGREDIQIAAGSWGFEFLPACDHFLPKPIPLIGLDYDVLKGQSAFDQPDAKQSFTEIAQHRPVIPIVWAHHDDGAYLGRPFTPFANFADKLDEMHAAGYGIIHWTMRPLDLYFKNLSKQVWLTTANQSLDLTCDEMAERSFGESAKQAMGDYLCEWITTGPQVARDTSNRFIDKKLKDEDIPKIITGCEQRIRQLKAISNKIDSDEHHQQRLRYYLELEHFIKDLCLNEQSLRKARKLKEKGDIESARKQLATCNPSSVIERYARLSQIGRITRGEQGLIVSMNLRWLVHFIRMQQELAMSPIRYNFSPTVHGALAQAKGLFTYYVSPNRVFWECLGSEETGTAVFSLTENERHGIEYPCGFSEDDKEICFTGLRIEKPVTLPLQPMLACERLDDPDELETAYLSVGNYRLTLLLLNNADAHCPPPTFDLTIKTPGGNVNHHVELEKARQCGRSVESRTLPIHLDQQGIVVLSVNPIEGPILLCGLILDPD